MVKAICQGKNHEKPEKSGSPTDVWREDSHGLPTFRPSSDGRRGARRRLVLAFALFAALVPAERVSGEVVVDADGWHEVDEGVEIRGLDVRFTETDQEVEIWDGEEAPTGSVGEPKDFTLSAEFRTVRVYGEDAVFEVRIRATGSAADTP